MASFYQEMQELSEMALEKVLGLARDFRDRGQAAGVFSEKILRSKLDLSVDVNTLTCGDMCYWKTLRTSTEEWLHHYF